VHCRMQLDSDVSAVVEELLDLHPYKGLTPDEARRLRDDPVVEPQWRVSG
jgi:hypothetical protein